MGPVEPDGAASLVGVLLRRYRCRSCGAVVVVGPRGIAPARLYAAGAIALALTLWGCGGRPARQVRRQVRPHAVVGATAAAGWASERWRSSDGDGLRALDEAVGLDWRLVVYLGDRRLKDHGIDVLPFWEFIAELGAIFPA